NYSNTPGSTFTVAVNMQVNEAGGLFYNSDDLAIRFDPTKSTVSNVRTGSLFGAVGNVSTQANVDNVNGTIRATQAWSVANPPTYANGTTGDIMLFDVTINAGAQIRTSTPLNLADPVARPATAVNGVAPGGNPCPPQAPNDPNVDGLINIVGPSGKLFMENANGGTGGTFTTHLDVLANTQFQYNSDDFAVAFDPSKLQCTGIVSGDYGNTNQSTQVNIDNVNGTIRGTQAWSVANPPDISQGALVHLATFTFQVASNATPGPTVLNLKDVITRTVTAINGGQVTLNPAPTAAATDPVDATVTITPTPNQPPFDSMPAATALPKVLFNPQNVAGLTDTTPNSATLSGTTAIVVSDPDAGTSNVTTIVSLTGTPALGSTGPVGILTLAGTTGLTVSGNNTASVTLTGTISNINNALNGLST